MAKMHMWPYEGKPHPVGKRHKGNKIKHWNKGPVQFRMGNGNYKEGK